MKIYALLYFAFALTAAFICYRRPIPDEYDRYVYEVVARSQVEHWSASFPLVKAENQRLWASPSFDSAEHMAQLEPIYAIRPVYIAFIAGLHRVGLPYQQAISLISVAAYLGIAVLLYWWTRSPLLCALAIATPMFIQMGRQGVPDTLNVLVILVALYCLIARRWSLPGVALLVCSVWIRTDSVIVCGAVLVWLAYQKRLELKYAAALLFLAGASVAAINHFSGNYGYAVLFRSSFIGGAYPALVSRSAITGREYLSALRQALPSLIPQIAPWVLLTIAAWRFKSALREWLMPVWLAALAHFVLFPSPEARYLCFAFTFSAVAFISSLVRTTDAYVIDDGAVSPGGRGDHHIARARIHLQGRARRESAAG